MSNQTILRALIASGLVFGAVTAFTPSAFAVQTDSVPLGGTVTTTLDMVSTPTGDGADMALDGAAAGQPQIVKVSDVDMTTNNQQGLLLTVTSGDLEKLGGTQPIAFQVTTVANGTGNAPASGAFIVPSGNEYTVGSSIAGDYKQDLYIKYTPAALQDPGDYVGSIGLTVTDK